MKLLKQRKPFVLLLIPLLLITVAAIGGITHYANSSAAPPPTPEPVVPQSDEEDMIRQAVEEAIQAEQPEALALLLYDTQIEQILTSSDGNWATAWLVPVDPQTGQVVPMEPGLALIRKTNQGWQAFVPSDPLWPLVIKEIPDELVSPEEKSRWILESNFQESAVTTTIHGYYLPYAGGDTMSLTQSVGHDRYTPSGNAHYAFDFAKPGYPSGLFNVHAARGGIVKRVVWTHPNGDPSNTNLIVLEDTSTSPTTYQLYMHFAQNSIPENLRVIGAPVRSGQLIGVADDTGVSSGNHLHFMVHTNPASYWGSSIDITFNDVTINAGRPRISSDLAYCKSSDVCDTTQTTYLSQNFMSPDHIPPTGGIINPQHGSIITTDVIPLQGWAIDENSGIARAQFQAFYSGSWHALGSQFTTTSFSYDWDLCTANVPDGPISLALSVMDKAQNQASGLPGLTHFTKNFECPSNTPTCSPSEYQIALFASPDYQGGCVLLGAGSYTSPTLLGALGDDNVASIMVGQNVQATLFAKANLQGRAETFFAQDSSLSENYIGVDTVSSARVQTRTTLPAIPVQIWPNNGASFPEDESISFSWENSGSTTAYQLQLSLSGNQVLLTEWSPHAFWHLNSIPPGDYSWRVKASNPNGESSWSASRTLSITQNSGSLQTSSISAPFEDAMELTPTLWKSFNWDQTAAANHTQGGSIGWEYDPGGASGYDNGSPSFGSLTSPYISIPAGSPFYLRFHYQQETEGNPRHWDQRWIQISVDGGTFTDLLQMSDDPAGYWLRSPVISLAPYSGHAIQIRFFFTTLDSENNQHAGWFIDDFSITTDPPPICQDEDNSALQGTRINYGDTISGVICPGGDLDFYQFQGISGDQIAIRTEAQNIGSPLDTKIELLDHDGKSILAENDDIIQFERTDSLISYHLRRTGVYYIKIQAWDHPTTGDNDLVYNLLLSKDQSDPTASFISPTDGSIISSDKTMLMVAARDLESGVALTRFYWHSNDWQNSDWSFLGEDWNPSDGWNFEFSPPFITDRNGTAVYAVVFDWAGNWVGTGSWNLHQPMLYLPLIKNSR